MATTTITVESFKLACAECADAIDDRDRTTALLKYAKAEVIQAGLELSTSNESAMVTRRVALSHLRDAINEVFGYIDKNDDDRMIATRTNFKGRRQRYRRGPWGEF